MSLKPLVVGVLLVGGWTWGSGCSKGPSPVAPTPVATPTPTPAPDPTAHYTVTFQSTWSMESHPDMFPRTPHFSGLIGGTHRAEVSFWAEGQLASDGIKNMAERGSKSPLDGEVQNAIGAGTAQHLLSGDNISRSPGEVGFDFQVSVDYPLVSLVCMLAPSPDWFVGVSGLSLLENGQWRDETVVELRVYDAGTDSGTTYGANNDPTMPRKAIHVLDGPPLAHNGQVAPVGTFTFRRQRR